MSAKELRELEHQVFLQWQTLRKISFQLDGLSVSARDLAEAAAPVEKPFTREEVRALMLRALLSWNDNSINLTARGTIDAVLKEAGR